MSSYASPVPGGRPQKRRRLIVEPGLQLRAQSALLLFLILYAALLGGLLFYPLQRSVAAEPDLAVRAILGGYLWRIHFHVWLLLGVAGLVAFYTGLRWSLKVAGPLYRLHRALNEMAEGEVKPLRFRRHDECHIFEEDVAQLNQKMKLIASRNRDILFAVHAHVKKLVDRLAAGDIVARADLEEAVAAMQAQLEKAPEISLAARR